MSGAENMLPKYTGKAMTSRLQRIPFLPSAFSLAVGVFTLGVWPTVCACQPMGQSSGLSEWLPRSLDLTPLLPGGSSHGEPYDGVAEWHLPNAFASWRNDTHAFVFGGQQSSFPLDTKKPIDNSPECNRKAGVM